MIRTTTRAAVAYVRASTSKQALSCGDQERAILDYCAREGLKLVHVYRDDGISGTLGRGARGGWDGLLAAVEAGELSGGVVVVWSLDRWSRDLRAGLLAAWAVGDHQVELHTTDGGRVDLDSVEGQVMGAMRLALAERESRERSRRTRERKAAHLAAGYWQTVPPYGYRLEGERGRKRLIPDPAEAPVVLELFRAFDGGKSCSALSRELNRRGLPTRLGNSWSASGVRRILSGWSYGGICRSLSGAAHPVACEAFVPRDLWERVREAASAPRPAIGRARMYPLSGKVICGECGRRMTLQSWPRTGGRSRRRGYRCPGRNTFRCYQPTILYLPDIEDQILGWWRSLIRDEHVRELAQLAVEREHEEAVAAARERAPIETEIRDLEAQELRLVDAIREAGISPVIARELDLVRGRRRAAEDRLGTIAAPAVAFDVEDAVAELAGILEEIRTIDRLAGYIDRIVAEPGRRVVVSAFGREVVF